MHKFTFNENARWIWTPEASRRANNFACFRRGFTVTGDVQKARFLITADARYELYVNGRWIGHGPIRSWTSPWPVDEYDLRGELQPGENVVAVLVQDIGVSTFQYILAAPGLLAQLGLQDQKGERVLATSGSWRCKTHEGYAWPVPRISCQQAWEEQFDARKSPGSRRWQTVGFDDSEWDEADVRGRPGEPPHETFELRDIPMLTRETVFPVRLRTAEAVRPADCSWSLRPRELLNPTDRSANRILSRILLLTHIHSENQQKVQFHSPGGGEWKLNGEALHFDDHSLQHTDSGVAHAQLEPGWNCLVCRLPEITHLCAASVNIWCDGEFRLASRPDGKDEGPPWMALGPFADSDDSREPGMGNIVEPAGVHEMATSARYKALWDDGCPSPEVLDAPFARTLGPGMASPVDVSAITSSDRTVEDTTPEIDRPEAILSDSAECSIIHPPNDGSDVRILLDFGDEIVGYHELEIDAPAGTIVDNQNFEFIQRDGRYNLAEGMNNSFRYVCREGSQEFRTFVRRGFRYSWLVLRDFDRPVRLRSVRAVFSTYPVDAQGDFSCSDLLLDRLWDAGARTLRCCAEDTYTDCPTYEQTHWVGDARNEALIDLLANSDPGLSRHCWIQAARSLDHSPLVQCHVPSGWPCILTAWSLLWMRWAEEHYLLTGDEDLAREMLRFIERNVCGLEQHINDQNLLDIEAWNMLDWAPMDTPNRGIVTHQNCLAVLALRQVAELARSLEQKGRAQRWDALAERMSVAINDHLWDEEKSAYVDCIHADGTRSDVFSQQTHTMAYLSGVPEDERTDRCLTIATDPPENFVTAGSPFFMFFVLEALTQAEKYDELLGTIREYWRPQIEAGATTFWEAYWPDRDRRTRSHCHAWSAAPTFFLPREILGIKPLEPGYKTVRVAPHPGDLDWAHGRVPSPHGTIECRWSQSAAGFELELRLPPATPARIELPFSGTLDVARGVTEALESPDGETHLWTSDAEIKLVLST